MIIKTLKEAEEKQKAGGVLLEIRGQGADKVWVFQDEEKPKKKEVKNEK